MERWRQVLRDGLFPLQSRETLDRLRLALRLADPDDPHRGGEFVQSVTVWPLTDEALRSPEPLRACLAAWCCWRGKGLKTASEVKGAFTRLCRAIDARMQDGFATADLTRFFDESPWHYVRSELLTELTLCLDAPADARTEAV